ncbi:MAG TPA: ketoacyl-ACP synthase III [Candidatus Latescibacteria bacterium]|nr:ketoacyl-ACP synthase III [Candidatus Latescibacterota bacterium]
MPWSYIAGTGSAVPERVLTNEDLENMVDTSDEWIRTRSGIERRHIAEEDETTATLGAEAARKALEDAGVSPEEVDFIIVATVTPEMLFPSTACVIQDMIGAKNAGAMDLSAGCSGFIYALYVADSFVRIGQSETVLVVASETLSKITDWTDRSTCVLFGDGAGAAVIMPSPDGERGIINTILGSDGSKGELLYMPAGGSRYPASHETVDKRMHYIKMNGREVFKIAVEAMGEAAASVVEGAGYRPEDVDLLIPHQANIRIIKATAKRLGISMDRVYVNIQEYGNTSAASIPIALDEAKHKGFLRPGDLVVAVAFGAGLTWASTFFRF